MPVIGSQPPVCVTLPAENVLPWFFALVCQPNQDGPGGAQQLGAPRSRAMIITALADRHPKDDVRRTLMRLAVTEQLVEIRGKYTLPTAEVAQG
jgi:hypothetical protein